MDNSLILASAGAGKTTRISEEAISDAENGKSVLILTYTTNNQKEIRNKICKINTIFPKNITIKGWFTFLLEDMIRPYQRCFFNNRVSNVYLYNEGNPHTIFDPKSDHPISIRGRNEIIDGCINSKHYFLEGTNKIYSTFISKLSLKIIEKTRKTHPSGRKVAGTKGKPIKRLNELYDSIYIDEVQDLVGWDYSLLKIFSEVESIKLTCVGDFRQTVYKTSLDIRKPPINNEDKIKFYDEENFDKVPMSISRRCIQPICSFSDKTHTNLGYNPTLSKVVVIPDEFENHQGVFVVRSCDKQAYYESFKPIILRHSKTANVKFCDNKPSCNFGKAKGLGFRRVLILPTELYKSFLAKDCSVFNGEKTDESRNKLYVAITRARYSVAFIYDGEVAHPEVEIWNPNKLTQNHRRGTQGTLPLFEFFSR